MKNKNYCDKCGYLIIKGDEEYVSELPCNIPSANKGESATLCDTCYDYIFKTMNNYIILCKYEDGTFKYFDIRAATAIAAGQNFLYEFPNINIEIISIIKDMRS